MKLVNVAALITAMCLAHLTSAAAIGQLEKRVLYRGVSLPKSLRLYILY